MTQSWIEREIERSKFNVKFSRKSFMTILIVMLFCLSVFIWNAYLYWHGAFNNGFSLGCGFVSFIYTFAFCLIEWADYRCEKHQHYYYEKLLRESRVEEKEKEFEQSVKYNEMERQRYIQAIKDTKEGRIHANPMPF